MAGQFQYARLARTAQRLIERFGNAETIKGFVDRVEPPYADDYAADYADPGTPAASAPNRPPVREPYTQGVKAVFLNIEDEDIDGILVKAGDMKVLVSPLTAKMRPLLTGTITRDAEGEVWSIVKLKTLNPGGIKLLYTLQVRR